MSSISILAYIILTLSIGYAFIYSPTGDLSALINEKQKYNKSLATVGSIENKKDELLTEFNNISTDERKEIDTILPDSMDFVKLVSQIDAVAASHGISIDKITSRELDSSTGETVEDTAPEELYKSSIIGFSFAAPYEEFGAFMGDLGKSLRILDISSVKLATQEGGVYSFSVEFKTYWLKPL